MNNENLKPFQPGSDPRRNALGRPRKLVTILKDAGYKTSEINDCISTMLSLTRTQLKEALANPNATTLEVMIGRSIQSSIRHGNLTTFEILLSRQYGKPKTTVEINNTPPEIEAAKNLYQSLLDKGLTKKAALKKVLTAAKSNGIDLTENEILNADSIE